MGTRADFYVGRGKEAEWLGSIAWDGHPGGIAKTVLKAVSVEEYRNNVAAFLERDDATLPRMGWPWPWEDSQTTDYAYAFFDGSVWGSCFGTPWFDARKKQPEDGLDYPRVEFPNMKERSNVTFGKRSGVMIFRIGP